MRVSIFTPTHNPSFLLDAYESLKAQTERDWEWIILLNGDATVTSTVPVGDSRVKVFASTSAQAGFIGALKAEACALCTGEILLELDHDDILLPTALADVQRAFDNPSVGFVYSNAIYATGDLKAVPRFDASYGWKWREHSFRGEKLDEILSFEPSPEALAKIWFAPDHLRSFRRSFYEKVGGYAKDMRVLDDQDLMCRMFLEDPSAFLHLNQPLYVYRIRGDNSWQERNKEIQDNVLVLYDRYAEKMAVAWAAKQNLSLIELGGRMNARAGFQTLDLKDADIVCDLNDGIPLPTSSVGVIRAMDVLEHLSNPIFSMKEISRVLAPGGWLVMQVPSTDGRGAFQDPTHKSFWNENSLLYYTDARWAKYIDTPVRFQAARSFTTAKDARGVCWVQAHLINLKDGYVPPGQVLI